MPPDIRVKDFIRFVIMWLQPAPEKAAVFLEEPVIAAAGNKKFSDLTKEEKARVLLSLTDLVDSPFYYFFDTAVHLSEDFDIPFSDKIAALNREKNAVVLYLTTDTNIYSSESRKKPGVLLLESDDLWFKMVNSHRN